MSCKKDHQEFRRKSGKFRVSCSERIFTISEIEIIRNYGHWFNALATDILKPYTAHQLHFISVSKGLSKALSEAEIAWSKYLGRKKLETENPKLFQLNYKLEEDSFFTREGYTKLHEK